MKEYKTVKVPPESVDKEIPLHEVFGWKLENTQEVYNESQEITGLVGQSVSAGGSKALYGGNVYSTGSSATQFGVQSQTRVTHYVSIRFSRETTMYKYEELRQLEEDYDKADKEFRFLRGIWYDTERPIKTMIGAAIGFVLGIILTVVAFIIPNYILLIGLAVSAVSILTIILVQKKYKKDVNEKETARQNNEKRMEELTKYGADIMNQAKAILANQ